MSHAVERHSAHPGLGVVDAGKLRRLAQGGDEGVLYGVLCFGEVAADRVDLDDQTAVRRVVQLVEVDCRRHGPPPPAYSGSRIASEMCLIGRSATGPGGSRDLSPRRPRADWGPLAQSSIRAASCCLNASSPSRMARSLSGE